MPSSVRDIQILRGNRAGKTALVSSDFRLAAVLVSKEFDLLFFPDRIQRLWRIVTSLIGDLEIDFSGYVVRKRGMKLYLTSKEFEILALLAGNPGQAFSREQIYEHIWGEDSAVDTNSITVFVRRIREKIEDKASQPAYVLTVWGVGYKFADRIDA